MVVYILNESKKRNEAGDVTIYNSLIDVEKRIEPVDVENGEYFLFDTNGEFYSIAFSGDFDRYHFEPEILDLITCNKVIQDHFGRVGAEYDDSKSLEENVRILVGS